METATTEKSPRVVIGEQQINSTNTATGDFIQTNYHVHSDPSAPSFMEVDLDENSTYPTPVFIDDYVQIAIRDRIIIIPEDTSFDAANFGREIAKRITQRHRKSLAFELIQNEENVSLTDQLKKRDHSTIILMNSLHPRHIQYDFEKLISICESKQAFYIISTESSQETWLKSGQASTDFWRPIPTKIEYDNGELVHWFIELFSESTPAFISTSETISEQTLISENASIKDVVLQINSPQKLMLFLNGCRGKTDRFTDAELKKAFALLEKSQSEVIAQWFNNLTHHQKVIAIGSALYSGLFSSQYFETFTQLAKSSFWKLSSEQIGSLDYRDLNFLHPFFRFEPTVEGDLILPRNHFTPASIIKAAIDQYSRHIEKALTVFSEIMKTSYKRTIENWELHGTQQRRALIRQVFIEMARDIGVNNLGNNERIYLELASSDHYFIQGVAAKSMAQYRQVDCDELLFDTIDKWLTSKSIQDRIDLFLREKPKNKLKTITAIKATSIRALAYSADYDRPNHLHEKIIHHLIEFSKDPDEAVQESVAKVLPKFIHHHSYQLRNQIFDVLMPNPTYAQAISDGLKDAYSDYPAAMKKVILHWLSICEKDASKDNRRMKATFRDNQLIAVLETLQKIPLGDDAGFSVDELYQISIELLDCEKRKAIVDQLTFLISRLQSSNYPLAGNYAPKILETLSREQLKTLVKLWTIDYMQERKELKGAEFMITLNNVEYPSWENPDNRPLTLVEETLFQWLNSDMKRAQKFATLVFLEIAHSFENPEAECVKEHIKQRELRLIAMEKTRKLEALHGIAVKAAPAIGLDFWLRVRIGWYLLFEKRQDKENLKSIIVTFKSEKYSKQDLRTVIQKWGNRQKGTFSTKLAKWLSKLIHAIKN